MPIKFKPNYIITSKIASCLLRIEAAKEKVLHLPLTPTVLASLRETARLYTTHYSTMIEGNILSKTQVEEVLKHEGHFPGREHDEHEVKGYYAALTQVEQWAAAARMLPKNGNGRTARLLTTLLLHLGGYDLKGLSVLQKSCFLEIADPSNRGSQKNTKN
jgi:Fic family protein